MPKRLSRAVLTKIDTGDEMKYEEFEEYVKHNFAHEAIYRDSDGHPILVIRLLDAYYMMNRLPREWVGLTKEELGLFVYDNLRDKKRYENYGRKIEEILKEKNT